MVIVLTGASSGIGAVVARLLTSKGHDVVAVSRTPCDPSLAGRWVQADLGDPEAIDRVAETAGDRVDALVHCAALCRRGALENLDAADIRYQFEVNVLAPIMLTRALAPALRNAGGCVVAVSSLAGRIGSPGNAVYSATKFALDGFLEAASYELAHVGIRSRVIIPLYAPTAMMASAAASEPPPMHPYTEFESATRARLDASVADAMPEDTVRIAELIVDAALAPGEPWFDRVVVGDSAALVTHMEGVDARIVQGSEPCVAWSGP